MITFSVPGQPVPKARPRWGKGRTYTPLKTREAELAVAWEFKRQMGTQRWPWPLDEETSLSCRFYMASAKGRRADIDNLVKLVLDGLNGVAYTDDRWITKLEAIILPADAQGARTIVSVGAR